MNKFFAPFIFISLLIYSTACKKKTYYIESTFLTINEGPYDTLLANKILPYKKIVDSIMSIEIGYTNAPIEKDKPEGPLNNLVCDAILNVIRKKNLPAHASIMNYGGLRNSIPAGKITISTIYETYPFDNEIVLVCLHKSTIEEIGKFILKKRGIPISGFKIQIDTLNNRYLISDYPFSTLDTFCICTSDYLSQGLDEYSFLQKGKIIPTGIKVREALIQYIKEKKFIKPYKDGRCSIIK